jgi:hypothetical protein
VYFNTLRGYTNQVDSPTTCLSVVEATIDGA